MDNKTKVKVAVVIGIVILAVIFIFMVIFVKGNRPQVNKNIPKVTNGYANSNKDNEVDTGNEDKDTSNGKAITLDNVVSIGIENGNLVEINNDYSSTIIKNFENENSDFCYGDSKVYIVTNAENGSCTFSEIDLLKSDFFEKTLFTTSDYGFINNLKYYGGKLYFVSEKGQLIEYSIEEAYIRTLTKENEVSSFAVNKENNCLYVSYKPNGENPGIYILDFTANTFTQIINLNDLAGELIFEGKSLVIDVKDFGSLYVYNTEYNTVAGIGADNALDKAENQVAFYNNVLLYTNGITIDLKDENGNSRQDGWYTLDDNSIAGISMLDQYKLQIARFDENKKISRSIIIDLTNGTTIEKTDTAYTKVVRIK